MEATIARPVTGATHPSRIRLGDLVPGANPRRGKNPARESIRASIREKGILQSLLVVLLQDGRYQLRAGFTRYELGLEELGPDYMAPVNVVEMTDDEAAEAALSENLHRGNMNPVEEAEEASRILARCNGDRKEVAKRLGLSVEVLTQRLALMNCVEQVRDALIDEKILLGHAELLAALPKAGQPSVLEKILAAPKRPTVEVLRQQIQQYANNFVAAIFDKTECASCPSNSGNQAALFAEKLDEGYCTNRQCWDRKTEEELEVRCNALKDEYPKVHIARPGENHTIVKLYPDGVKGVGETQFATCKSCANYGAAVSAVPGKMGEVFKGFCFDAACNAEKIKLNQQAILEAAKAAESAAASATSEKTKQGDKGKVAVTKSAAKASPSVTVSSRVKEYAVKIWRHALAKHLMGDARINEQVLVVLAMTGNGRHIDSNALCKAYAKHADTAVLAGAQLPAVLQAVTSATDEVLSKMRTAIAASVASGIDQHVLVQLLLGLNVNLATTWKVNAEYLALLTKSEIEVMAEQIGIKAHVGEKFSKLLTGKKDEVIKKVLEVEGFDFTGKIPANMQYATSK